LSRSRQIRKHLEEHTFEFFDQTTAWPASQDRLPHHKPGRARRGWPAALDINSFTPVRMLADCVETTEVLQYQRVGSHVCRVCFASTPHTCWLNCDSSDTVGFTPHICKGNHVEGCPPQTASKSSLHQCGNKLTVFPHLIPPDSNRMGIEK
jgi:hypothetical protein